MRHSSPVQPTAGALLFLSPVIPSHRNLRRTLCNLCEKKRSTIWTNVINTARTLLEEGMFASTLKAKIRFPEVFEVSPTQSAGRSASEVEAAKSEAYAIKHAAEGHQAEWTTALADTQEEVQGRADAKC